MNEPPHPPSPHHRTPAHAHLHAFISQMRSAGTEGHWHGSETEPRRASPHPHPTGAAPTPAAAGCRDHAAPRALQRPPLQHTLPGLFAAPGLSAHSRQMLTEGNQRQEIGRWQMPAAPLDGVWDTGIFSVTVITTVRTATRKPLTLSN